MSSRGFDISAAHPVFDVSTVRVHLDAIEEAASPDRDSPPPRPDVLPGMDTALEAARWPRLKNHLADLAPLVLEQRKSALENLQLEVDDRRWLTVLAKPLLSVDPRLPV